MRVGTYDGPLILGTPLLMSFNVKPHRLFGRKIRASRMADAPLACSYITTRTPHP